MHKSQRKEFIKSFKYGILYLVILVYLLWENYSSIIQYEGLSQREQRMLNKLDFESTESYDCSLQILSKEEDLLKLDKPFEQCKRRVVHHDNVNNNLVKEINRLKSNQVKLRKQVEKLSRFKK